MDVLALLLGLLISWYFAAGLLVYILASRAYSYRGIRLKKYPILGWLTVAGCQGALVFFLVYQGSHPPNAVSYSLKAPVEAMIACSLLLGGFYPLTQIYQHEADRRDGVRTLSMVLGYRGSFVFAGLLYIIAFLLLAYYFLSTIQITGFCVLATCMLPVVVYFLSLAGSWSGELCQFDPNECVGFHLPEPGIHPRAGRQRKVKSWRPRAGKPPPGPIFAAVIYIVKQALYFEQDHFHRNGCSCL